MIYFFDDILSAVDASTQDYLWKHTLLNLYHQKKTIILVTHQLQYLNDPDISRVIVLANSTIHLNDK